MRISVALLLPLLLFTACKDNTVTVYVHDQGTYQGHIAQYGVDGKLSPSQSGATIAIKGTSYAATTDANGDYQLKDIPAGIYGLLFSRPGFDSTSVGANQFSGAGTVFIDTQRIQAIPYDSMMAIGASLHLDSISKHEPWDTISSLRLVVQLAGPDAPLLTRCSVEISKDLPNGDTTYLGDEVCTITHGTSTTIEIRPGTYLGYRSRVVHPGDEINVFLRPFSQQPAGLPYFVPTMSPFMTMRKLQVQ